METMEHRVNKVKEIFVEFFGFSPDIVYYEKGKVIAFNLISKNGRIFSLYVKESEPEHKVYSVEVIIDN